MKRPLAIIAALLLLLHSWVPAAAETRLVMFEAEGCFWCERWKREIGPIYPKSAEGSRAPLQIVNIRDATGYLLERSVVYTPTFILLQDGIEVGRIEGYPGEAFFWGLLEGMIETVEPSRSKS